MKQNKLGPSDLRVSEICLGTMTWGSQNSEQEAHEQIDYALSEGVNFIDTAELYPTTPLSAETQGSTEDYIGSWFKKSGRRQDVVLATKISGPGNKWIRNGSEITPQTIEEALNDSLRRLQTDYIDLYQLHWPNRGSYHFRQIWGYNPTRQDRAKTLENIQDVLQALQGFIKKGKIRNIGLSNESSWGTAQYLDIARAHDLPPVVSIQNEYNLMCRLFDWDLAELSHNEAVGLLAYSPLAAGMLSGKYQSGKAPEGSRRAINATLHGRYSDHTKAVVDKYLAIASAHDLDPSQMALAFCLTRPFMTSVIIGATSREQLQTNIGAAKIKLTDDVQKDINAVHRIYPVPF